jgi:hypothetical protein
VKRRISFFYLNYLFFPTTRFFVAEPKVLSVAEALLRMTLRGNTHKEKRPQLATFEGQRGKPDTRSQIFDFK